MPDRIRNFFHSLIIDTMNIRDSKGIIRPDMIHLLMQAKKGTLEENDSANGPATKPSMFSLFTIYNYLLF